MMFERAKAACTLICGSAGCFYYFDFNALYIDVSNRTPPPDNALRKFLDVANLALLKIQQAAFGDVGRKQVGRVDTGHGWFPRSY